MAGMNKFESIRRDLLLTQDQMAKILRVSQANISNYENAIKPQTLPPKKASLLIAYAKSKGVELTYDKIYADQLEADHKPG
jgi:DNA-binding XRE family transcriptional regulator